MRREGLRIFFSAGEPSGDLHGANLIRQLKARDRNLQAVGYGGPKMAAAGCRLHADLTALAVMWFLRVIGNLHKFWNLASLADRYFRHHKPDAVVLIDYPGFNMWIARRAKAHGIPVFYYSPPQVWAWARWRVKKMRRLVDHVLCGLPFEEDWFRQRGCATTYVGHPFFDEIDGGHLDRAFLEAFRDQPGPLVVILPGSRTQEVADNLRWFLKACRLVGQTVPGVRFAVASFKPHQAEMARRAVYESGLCVDVHVGRTPELIRLADCCMACSGSVSLELMAHAKPTVVLYWVSRLAYTVQRYLRKVKYITLVNLLAADDPFDEDLTPFDPSQPGAERVLFPEYLTWEDKTPELAGHVIEWLTDASKRAARVRQLAELRDRIARPGASRRAAEFLLAALARRKTPVPRPHFLPAPARHGGGSLREA